MPETKQTEVKQPTVNLQAEVDRLRAENESLRRQLTSAGRPAANPEPRFELSAGEQHDLQVHGVTRSVRNGGTLVASDFPDEVDQAALSDEAKAADARERKARDARTAAN